MNPPDPHGPPPQRPNFASSGAPGAPAPLKVFFGTIGPGMPGGLYISESAFQAACVRTGEVEPIHISFGRQSPSEGPVRMAVRQTLDLFAYAIRVLVERPDLVHLNTAFDRRALGRDIGFVWLSSLLRQPLYLKFHGSDADLLSSKSRVWRWLSREVIHRADAIGVLSSEERENFVRAGYDGRKFHVVKNVVDWRRFRAGGWPRPKPEQLLFIARFIPAKGLLDVIRALKILRDQGRAVRLICVGDGPERQDAENLASGLRLDGAVQFTGQISELDTTRHYLDSFALVIPTRHPEGFSMTIFQSLAAGLPILTTEIRAAADYLSEPENVLWVQNGQPERLAERIAWLMDHEETAAAMSRNNMLRAQDFDGEALVREFVPVYRAIARRRGAETR